MERTRFWGVWDPDELSEEDDPDSDSEYEVSDESIEMFFILTQCCSVTRT